MLSGNLLTVQDQQPERHRGGQGSSFSLVETQIVDRPTDTTSLAATLIHSSGCSAYLTQLTQEMHSSSNPATVNTARATARKHRN
ncbi:hypothetical protein EYF80_003523 [Liparis tanakae]|uniref:Uncharacterized protein n=1 Tax=Liparis tanakae TaxID=230148 RepID=A0A4Z2J7D1_9TELE|nr:hypothetical protein EYF80_003523 [Liparis tanakae]